MVNEPLSKSMSVDLRPSISPVLSPANSFAADAATCERSVKNVYDLMYPSPKDKEKLKSDALQSKMKKDIEKCSSTSQAVAECHASAKSFADVGKCPKK